jgi:hypothetical protein
MFPFSHRRWAKEKLRPTMNRMHTRPARDDAQNRLSSLNLAASKGAAFSVTMSDRRSFMSRPACLFLAGLLALAAISCARKAPYEGKSIGQLEAMLHDANPAVQAQGAYGLGLHGAEASSAVPTLSEALRSEHVIVRQKAAIALGQIGPDARTAVPQLTEALRDPEWTVRRNAAVSLGQVGTEARSALPALQRLRKDPEHLVRKAAQEALAKVSEERR